MTVPTPSATRYRPRLQRRLMLAMGGYTLLVGLVLSGLAMVFAYVVEDEFFVSVLRAEAQRQQAHRADHGQWTPALLPFVRLYPRGEGLPEDLARRRAAYPQGREFKGDAGRHYHLHTLDAQGSLLVAEVGGQLVVRPLRRQLLLWFAGWGGLLTGLALVLAWLLARRISAPLARLAHQVATSRPDALPLGLARDRVHDEVGELARHLDALHARTGDFIARERAFTADASHELRTPLAVLGLACERLGRQAPPETQALVGSMQAAVWQLQQTVDLLLALSREAAQGDGPAAEQALLPELEQLLLAYAPVLEHQGVQVELEVSPRLTRPWPPALTRLLLGNLLANAMAHGQSPRIRIEADATRVSVCNASAPPPPELLAPDAAGRTRGIKGPASTGEGAGLCIVRRLAERHGLALELSHQAGLTCATLRTGPSTPTA